MPTGTKRNTKIVDGVQYNQCTKCGEWFPATLEYFHFRSDTQVLYAKCKKCVNEQNRAKPSQHPEKRRAYSKEYNKRPYVKEKRKKLRVVNKERDKIQQKKWREDNNEHVIEYREKNRERDRLKNREHYNRKKEKYLEQSAYYMRSKATFEKYKGKLTVDEDAKPDQDGNLLVKCTYCGRYFIPTNREVLNRISVLGGGKNLYGEARLYCSNSCKISCPTFGQQLYHRGQTHYANREVDPLLRQMALELDNYECQRCGRSIDEVSLHVHHILPYRKNPMMGNDIDNTLTLCIDCHLSWMHSKDGYGCVDTKCIS